MVDYISLNEATKYCNYSADYLKLRARQGKLRAVKIGRNWVTTPEWVKEYNNKIPNYKFQITNKLQFPLDAKRTPRRVAFQTLKYYILGTAVILIVIGIFINFDVFKEYYQWQTANLSGVLEVIPSRVIEVK